jgi:excinuclease UvrABC nuclease subunit
MPFAKTTPHAFSPVSVRTYAPSAPGMYGISNSSQWIFIGAAADIQSALLSYFDDLKPEIMRFLPAGFVFEVCRPQDQGKRIRQLITEYAPVCNRT